MVRQHKKATWLSAKRTQAILEALKKARVRLGDIDRMNLPPESLMHKGNGILIDFYNEVINAVEGP